MTPKQFYILLKTNARRYEVNIVWRKCHLGGDGASVFTGRHNGVVARLVRDHNMEHSVSVYCICHCEALAAADAVKAVCYLHELVTPTVAGVYRQFHKTSVKEASLHDFQQALDLSVLY